MELGQIDLTDLDLFASGDPHEAFRTLRREAPVYWHSKGPGGGFWAITRYSDARIIFDDAAAFSSERGVALNMSAVLNEATAGFGQMMLLTDPPRHGQIRSLINRKLTPRAAASHEPRIREITAQIIGSVLDRGECDFAADVAARLPAAVIFELMGVPQADWDRMMGFARLSIGTQDPEYRRHATAMETGTFVAAETFSYFSSLINERARNPGDDLVSALLRGQAGDAQLSEIEVLFNCFLLIMGGQTTTSNAISGGILAAMENPEQMTRLESEPSIAPLAVEEFARWTSPVIHIMRTAARDYELHGHLIRKGDRVVVWTSSANRDEEEFADAGSFIVDRAPNDHIAFGHGEHFCIGANLARLEMRVMIEEVLDAMTELEIAGPVERLRSSLVGGIKHMPVRFKRRRPRGRAAA
jgi:cholest-4-en-3-one 26-monooxygenase